MSLVKYFLLESKCFSHELLCFCSCAVLQKKIGCSFSIYIWRERKMDNMSLHVLLQPTWKTDGVVVYNINTGFLIFPFSLKTPDYVSSSVDSFQLNTGAIFGLYLLYFTQPSTFKKIPIRLTMGQWQSVQHVYKQAFELGSTDLIFVIHKMRTRNAFHHVVKQAMYSTQLSDEDANFNAQAERTLIHLEKEALDRNLVRAMFPLENGTT